VPRAPGPHVPLSTYRIQLRPDFGFDEVAAVAPYLARLGVSHLYASPCLQAAPGSTHGYDVVDPTRPNSELGGAGGHRRMCEALGAAGLGQVLDIVPNHMAIGGPENSWWWDVLENGPSSVYASYFDVDWDPPEAKLRNTVLLPILADHYGRVLDAGELTVECEGGSFCVRYGDRLVPVAPRTLDDILERASAAVRGLAPDAEQVADELESIAAALGNLPHSWATDRDSVRARHRDKEVLRSALAQLCSRHRVVANAIDETLAAINADPDALDALLERQNYRLAHWRVASEELDYRRFFDIDTLIGVRVEDPAVFEDSHGLVLSWLAAGVIDGLRVDHIDGLADPAGYLDRLSEQSSGAWLVVEKILESGESLRTTWPVAGTTGYEWVRLIGGLFVDPAGEEPFTELWQEVSGSAQPFAEVAHRAKHTVMADSLKADLARLTSLFVAVCERRRAYRDYTRSELAGVLEEVIASMGVYRTYVVDAAHPDDVAWIEAALAEAARRRPELDPDLLAALGGILLATEPVPGPAEAELRMRFQQLTPPVMAKGVEDTALYEYGRLVAMNEVGCDPGRWATHLGEFHAAAAGAAERWPASMVTTSTHDTKRSEDVRARLYVLSEIAELWASAVRRWMGMNSAHRSGDHPDPATEYILYQTLVGAWPISAERMVAYMSKATKEAKVHTSWTDPDPAYDQALEDFIRSALDDGLFVSDTSGFVEDYLLEAGWVTSLAQVLCKLTVPGVPDTYQGCELWDYSLVDPDNRRPVNFEARRAALDEAAGMTPEVAWSRAAEGLPKLYLIHRALGLRRDRPACFGAGSGYAPVEVSGPGAKHVVAFARAGSVVSVFPRLVGGWGLAGGVLEGLRSALAGTTVVLGPGSWVDVLSGDPVAGGRSDVGELLSRFPVALLARSD
jgi:(1->4)-alpha-D-glucan 1-alpha-D-glucosylmutase